MYRSNSAWVILRSPTFKTTRWSGGRVVLAVEGVGAPVAVEELELEEACARQTPETRPTVRREGITNPQITRTTLSKLARLSPHPGADIETSSRWQKEGPIPGSFKMKSVQL